MTRLTDDLPFTLMDVAIKTGRWANTYWFTLFVCGMGTIFALVAILTASSVYASHKTNEAEAFFVAPTCAEESDPIEQMRCCEIHTPFQYDGVCKRAVMEMRSMER